MTAKPRVIHFVTGGGSGSTRVAIELACAHLRTGNYEPLLVFRRKKVPLPAPMQAQITAVNLESAWVNNGPTTRTRRQLATLIDRFKPQIFVAHGNSEHLWDARPLSPQVFRSSCTWSTTVNAISCGAAGPLANSPKKPRQDRKSVV